MPGTIPCRRYDKKNSVRRRERERERERGNSREARRCVSGGVCERERRGENGKDKRRRECDKKNEGVTHVLYTTTIKSPEEKIVSLSCVASSSLLSSFHSDIRDIDAPAWWRPGRAGTGHRPPQVSSHLYRTLRPSWSTSARAAPPSA